MESVCSSCSELRVYQLTEANDRLGCMIIEYKCMFYSFFCENNYLIVSLNQPRKCVESTKKNSTVRPFKDEIFERHFLVNISVHTFEASQTQVFCLVFCPRFPIHKMLPVFMDRLKCFLVSQFFCMDFQNQGRACFSVKTTCKRNVNSMEQKSLLSNRYPKIPSRFPLSAGHCSATASHGFSSLAKDL